MRNALSGRVAGLMAAALGVLVSALAPARPADEAWRHRRGDTTESLTAFTLPDFGDAPAVVLPHRLHAPNTALWYMRRFVLPAEGALTIDADDGAQVFIDGTQVPGIDRTFPVPAGLSGEHAVTVRVLNNAMAGGLRGVRILSPTERRAAAQADGVLPSVDWLPPADSPEFARRMPAPDRPCAFSVWGDSQGGWATFETLVARMSAETSDVSIGVGDLVNDGAKTAAWRRFVDVVAPLARVTPVAAVAGNHDYDGFYDTLRATHYLALLRPRDARPWFAWSCGPVRFMAIDVNTEFPLGISPQSEQARWIEREVTGRPWRDAGWRVLVVHQPPWSRSWAGYDGDLAVRRWVERLAASSSLDVVFSGHSHAYERLARVAGGRRVHVVITGGAGGTLEDAAAASLDGTGGDRVIVRHHYVRARATATTLTWDAVDAAGTVLDRHTIGPAEPRSRRVLRSGRAPRGR